MTRRNVINATKRENAAGGSAAAGGMNFHARVASVAAAHLLANRRLGWVKDLEVDTPIEIWCETNGPGDDLRFVLANGLVVEAQVKKGLSKGADLWTTLVSLARGLDQQTIAYGVLVVDNNTSATIRQGLANGIMRLGAGREDSQGSITTEFKNRLEALNLPVDTICARLRIVVLHCADNDDASEQAAKAVLMRSCANERDAEDAWKTIQLSAHGIIERRSRWTLEALSGVMRAANIELVAESTSCHPIVTSGCMWELLDEISPYRGYIRAFRQHYLLSDATGSQPFGGRDSEYEQLDTWLSDGNAPGRNLICAPTARGKSALLVQWTERLASDATWSVVFVPISLRFNTDRPVVFYALLAMQLARLLGKNLSPPAADIDSYYQGISTVLLEQAAKESRHILIVIDGLDEAQGAGFNPIIIPRSLPCHIKILVSAREQAGDRGTEGWLKRLDWQGNTRAVSQGLRILDRTAVPSILESAGFPKELTSDALIDRLMVLSSGEPLLLSLYTEDLSEIAKSQGYVGVETLDNLSPGFSAYFSRVFDSHHFAGDSSQQDLVDTALAVLAMALGPIEGPDLTDLVAGLTGQVRPAASDRFIKPLKRFVAGDGRIDHGYVLNHPKLGEYLREERCDTRTQSTVDLAFVNWGRSVLTRLNADPNAVVPPYVLQQHVEHLRRAKLLTLDDIELLLAEGWRTAWFRMDKDYSGYADSLLTASSAMLPCAAYQAEQIKALRLRIKIALLVSSVRSQGTNVPAELLAMALKEQLITLRQALNIVSLQLPENRTGYSLALASCLPPAELEQLHSDIMQTSDVASLNHQLAQLTQYLIGPKRDDVIAQVLNWLNHKAPDQQRIGILATLLPVLDDKLLDSALRDLIPKMMIGQPPASAAISAIPIIETLHARSRSEHAKRIVEQCVLYIDIGADPLLEVEALGRLSIWIDRAQLETSLKRLTPLIKLNLAVQSMRTMRPGDFHEEHQMHRLKKAATTLEILEIQYQSTTDYQGNLQKILAPLLTTDYWDVDTLLGVLPLVHADTRQAAVSLIHPSVLGLPTANNRTHALMALARFADSTLRKIIVEQAFPDARRIEDEYSRGLTIVALFSELKVEDKTLKFNGLIDDLSKVKYALHLGELLIQISNQCPQTEGFEEYGLQHILRVTDFGNSLSTLLRELPKLPQWRRVEIFRLCWERLNERTDNFYSFQLGMAARYAPECWTRAEFDVARSRLEGLAPYFRLTLLVDLLPVAKMLGVTEAIDQAFEEIATHADANERLSKMIEAIKILPLSDLRRNMLPQFWTIAANLEDSNIHVLIQGFELLSEGDKTSAWPKLITRAKTATGAGQSLARLSQLATAPNERVELLNAALTACAAEKSDTRISLAAQIVSACVTAEEKWRAFDLMTDAPVASRDVILSAIRIAAPHLAKIDDNNLIQDLMDDIRQAACWWP
ncbi:hypothetical protein SAMN05192549_12715 [Duganella sacchari]|uniref:NACHT domain-containing protein n=1 Tax=Duganella sacchari TaxID=551987 RepID=A0A1M7RF92_9BURK|nr:hypothetical protein [Duganella sacchari]SHN44831.1 hypothetical protein SAMN05192549_12715 [Duganella sacchari]